MHVFDRDMGGVQESEGVLNVTLSDQWSINHVPNGGYSMALLTRAMLNQKMSDPKMWDRGKMTPDELSQGESADKDHIACIVTANYMDRCDPKPAQILMETIGESRHFIRKQARLVQDNKERIRAMGTFVKSSEKSLPRLYEKKPERVAPPDQCIEIPPMGGGYSLFDQVDMRLDPACAGWTRGELTDRSVQKGWIRFKENRALDVPAITFFADSFPPCVFASQGMLAWVPTIEFSVNVRQLPVPGWLRVIFTTRFISSGLVEEDGELWDEENNLIAVSRQIAKYHLPLN